MISFRRRSKKDIRAVNRRQYGFDDNVVLTTKSKKKGSSGRDLSKFI
jgi:hypothetical protein